ncbi:hypothetical protein AK830_g4357 [Neonectria ditissima]|uniref:Uncharacterized protein n=1 Tax=Neonectria ditissima TaxID=78410 RepID=A0A0P7BNN6_9HYPO|nr:hypothetical protein AK830_g4357 [Neonectria ditissima]
MAFAGLKAPWRDRHAMSTNTPTTHAHSSITSRATVRVPHYTPPAGCLASTNIFYQDALCSWGTGVGKNKPTEYTCNFFALGDYDPESNCLPGPYHIATQCPEHYAAARTDDETVGAMTSREVICCPTTYDFYYGAVPLRDQRGSSASFGFGLCIASSPTFSGRPPWTLDISYWSTTTLGAEAAAPTEVIFDPETDVLMASAATIRYVVDKDKSTCVPDCESPYTGGQWPVPAPTHPPGTPAPDDSSLRGVGEIVGGIVGGVGGIILLVVGCCVWGRRRTKRKRRMAVAVAQEEAAEQEGPSAVQMVKM